MKWLVFSLLMSLIAALTAADAFADEAPIASTVMPPRIASMGFGAGAFTRAYRTDQGPLALEAFLGDWRLISSQGQPCAMDLKVSSPMAAGLRLEPADGASRPRLDIPKINFGDWNTFELSAGWIWSRAVGERNRIYQTSTIRSFFLVHTRLEREIEIMQDGSMVVTVSDRRDSHTDNYRCVYTSAQD